MTDHIRFWSKVNKTSTCWLWTAGKFRDGYGQYGYQKKRVRAHRHSYFMAHGPVPGGLQVLHKCDNPLCVRPSHLFLGTPKDNSTDMANKGRMASKLTNKRVKWIRRQKEIDREETARKFGVSSSVIRRILLNQAWKHV